MLRTTTLEQDLRCRKYPHDFISSSINGQKYETCKPNQNIPNLFPSIMKLLEELIKQVLPLTSCEKRFLKVVHLAYRRRSKSARRSSYIISRGQTPELDKLHESMMCFMAHFPHAYENRTAICWHQKMNYELCLLGQPT